jgi:hypothetical protein
MATMYGIMKLCVRSGHVMKQDFSLVTVVVITRIAKRLKEMGKVFDVRASHPSRERHN